MGQSTVELVQAGTATAVCVTDQDGSLLLPVDMEGSLGAPEEHRVFPSE